ncbi:hypothetical protein QTO34_013803 [Cnephaeus nilssonii]|uniref:Solute carrier organic anion transporter family member 4C1 n=1 Tax=Cnephaeus nilssonii TaxID=3371016 RepID=A0AA40I8P1_CNENI|nr:hypothetical protein QTO34_013803 [Eptesicus nilssonii]
MVNLHIILLLDRILNHLNLKYKFNLNSVLEWRLIGAGHLQRLGSGEQPRLLPPLVTVCEAIGGVYYNCSCIEMKTEITPPAESIGYEAKAGKCETRCTHLPIFLGIFFAAVVFTFMAGTPITVSILRCVNQNQRSLALGIQFMMLRLLGSIPGPIIFGVTIDSTCILWDVNECGIKGACWIYDNIRMARMLVGISVTCKIITIFFNGLAIFLYNPPSLDTEVSFQNSNAVLTAVSGATKLLAPFHSFHSSGQPEATSLTTSVFQYCVILTCHVEYDLMKALPRGRQGSGLKYDSTAMAQTLSSHRRWRHELSVPLAQSATSATPCVSRWPNRGRSGVMMSWHRKMRPWLSSSMQIVTSSSWCYFRNTRSKRHRGPAAAPCRCGRSPKRGVSSHLAHMRPIKRQRLAEAAQLLEAQKATLQSKGYCEWKLPTPLALERREDRRGPSGTPQGTGLGLVCGCIWRFTEEVRRAKQKPSFTAAAFSIMPVGYEKHGYVSVTIADAHPDNISQCQKLDSDTCKVGTQSGSSSTMVGKLRLASHMRLFGPLSVALPQNTTAWLGVLMHYLQLGAQSAIQNRVVPPTLKSLVWPCLPLQPLKQPQLLLIRPSLSTAPGPLSASSPAPACRCGSHVLTALAQLAPSDCAEQLGPVPAAGASGSYCPNHPSGAGRGGEALMGDQGLQPPLAPADGAERLAPAPGTYS